MLGPEMLDVLRGIALDKKLRPTVRMVAVNAILDRGFGRSTQQLHLLVDDTGGGPGILEGMGTVERQQLLLTIQKTIDASSPTIGRPVVKNVTPATNGAEGASRPLTGLATPVASTLETVARPIPPEREIQGPPEANSWDSWAVVDPVEPDGPPAPEAAQSSWGRARRAKAAGL